MRSFFGLSDEYAEHIYETFFLLEYHGGWSFTEAYNLPVVIRSWFVNRLAKQFEDEKEQHEKAMKKSKRSR